MLCQIYIFDIIPANSILWQIYIANILVNPCSLLFTFYKINLFRSVITIWLHIDVKHE